MKHPVESQLVMRFRKATGLPVLVAKRRLEKLSPEEQLSCIVAAENRPSGILRDPLENDEAVGPIIRHVMASVAERVRQDHELRIAKNGSHNGRLLVHWTWDVSSNLA